MDLSNDKAFTPFMSDRVTVYSVTQVPGKVAKEQALFACSCMITSGAEIAMAGAAAKAQTGAIFQVVIPAGAWRSALPPAAGTTKIECPTRGVLMVQTVGRIGNDWALTCIGKGVRG